jgi:magnesium-transporting ATPase (P-type)
LSFLGAGTEIGGYEIAETEIFNSTDKYSSVTLSNGRRYYKGAPEVLVGRLKGMNSELENYILEQAKNARRVLCLAWQEQGEEQLNLSGFACITDPVRDDAVEAVKNLHGAGVHVMMVTGDRAETAVAVAKEAGIYTEGEHYHYTDNELTEMTDEQVGEQLERITVVSRATPMTKLRLVNIAQAKGIVCGMTGDGVNDAPALNKADVGFAMGSGTEAAKEAGDVTILDDSLMSIKNAIWYGRTVFRNIQKFCRFQLTMNVSAVFCVFLPVLFSLFWGFEMSIPLTIVQLLWINLIMDTLGAAAFGNEAHKKEYMEERPKARDAAIVDKSVFTEVLVSGAALTTLALTFLLCTPLLRWLDIEQYSIVHTTMFFTLFVFAALVNGLTIRQGGWNIFKNIDTNPNFIRIFAGIAMIQILYATVLSNIDIVAQALSLTPLTIVQVGIVFIGALFMLPVKILTQKLVLRGN